MKFSQWLRYSNEAKPYRDAFELVDKMPSDNMMKHKCFEVVQNAASKTWEKTKNHLEL